MRTVRDRQVATHYDAHPFDNFTPNTLAHMCRESLLGKTLQDRSRDGQLQVDVGCGTGKLFALMDLCGYGGMLGIDISSASLAVARRRYPLAPLVQASALARPIRDRAAALVLCVGVLHHTSDQRRAFHECARTVAAGGALYVSVYDAEDRYKWVYHAPGSLLRALGRQRFGSWLLDKLFIPMWYLYFCYVRSLFVTRQFSELSYSRCVNLFFDRYMVPQASFHRRAELEQWGADCGLDVVDRAKRGAMIEMLFSQSV